MSEHKIPIPSMIYNAAVGGHVTNSQQIIDENLNREQQDINEEVAAVPYNATTPNGMGKIVLKKNDNFKQVVEAQTNGNTIFVIKYDFTITDDVTIPTNCVLEFDGGSILGAHTVTGANTGIKAGLVKIFSADVTLAGSWNIAEAYSEWFGAVGDGSNNDTAYIQKCLNSFNITSFLQYRRYKINTTITIPRNKSINGNRAEIVADSNFSESSIGPDVPSTTIFFLQGREAIWQSEKLMRGSYIKDLKITGNDNNVAIYIGTEDSSVIEQISNVNYSVDGYCIDNINIDKCTIGLKIQDCWNTTYRNCIISCSQYPIHICGQSINNVFTGCRCYGGTSAIRIEGRTYSGRNAYIRPEGCSFNGGFYGNATIGVDIVSCLAFYFSNCIIDLNSSRGVSASDATDVTMNSCYIYATPTEESQSVGIEVTKTSTLQNNTFFIIDKCYIRGFRGIIIGDLQNNVTIKNCNIDQNYPSRFVNCGYFALTNNSFQGSTTLYSLEQQRDENNYNISGNYIKNNGSGKNIGDPFNDKKGSIKLLNDTNTYEVFYTNIDGNKSVKMLVSYYYLTVDGESMFMLDIQANNVYLVPIYGNNYPDLKYIIQDNKITVYVQNANIGLRMLCFDLIGQPYPEINFSMKQRDVSNLSLITIDTYQLGSLKFVNNKPQWWNGTVWVDATNVVAGTSTSGTFADKPTVSANNIPVGFKYFCTDKQTSEGATNGIEIIHKGNNVWVDALGRVVS